MAEGWNPSIGMSAAPEGNLLPNPLEFFGKMQAMQQQQNLNLKFRQDNDARVAVGEAYKQAIDPATGRLDEVKLLEILRRTSAGNVALPDVLSAAQAREKEARLLEEQKLDLGRKRIGIASGVAGSLLSLPDEELTKENLFKALARAGAQYGDAELLKTMFLGTRDFAASGAALRKDIVQAQTQMLTAMEQFDRRFPAPQLSDTGGVINVLRTDGFGNVPQVLGQLTKTPTPAERNAQVPFTNPDGSLGFLPRDRAGPMFDGQGNLVNRPPAPGTGAPATEAPKVLGPNVEQAADLTAAAKFANDRQNDIAAQLIAGQKNMQEIESMRKLLEGISTGPFAPMRTTVARGLQELGFPDMAAIFQGGASPAAVSDAEVFMKKAWTQSLSAMNSAMPAGTRWTGQETMMNFQNNPNITLTPNAIKDLFDFEAFRFNFLKEEQDFRLAWRRDNPEKPLRQLEKDWLAEAVKKGWVTSRQTGSGEVRTTFLSDKLVRDTAIPSELTLVDLSMIPKGGTSRFQLDDGSIVSVKRGREKTKLNTYTLVR